MNFASSSSSATAALEKATISSDFGMNNCSSDSDVEYLNSEFKRHLLALNWEKAETLLKAHPKDIKTSARIGILGETALHFAAAKNQAMFVEELVNVMSEEEIAMETKVGETAFLYALEYGNTEAARTMLKKIPDQIDALINAIHYESYAIAKEILLKYPRLATRADKLGDTTLYAICGKVSEAGHKLYEAEVELMSTLLIEANGDVDLIKGPLFEAAERGNYEFIRIALNLYPNLTNEKNDRNQTVLAVAGFYNSDILDKINSKKKKKKKRATKLFNTMSVRFAELREKPPSLETLAIQTAGLHMEQVLKVLDLKAVSILPLNIKLAFLAICRRKDLLDDNVLNKFSDELIEILDISDSDATDFGLSRVAIKCLNLRALDISGCSKITKSGVTHLIRICKNLKTLRWGGCPDSDQNARNCLPLLGGRPIPADKDSWEDIDLDELHGANVDRLIWPGIGDDMLKKLATEYPSVLVNPVPIPGAEPTQREALEAPWDEIHVKDIDAKVWVHEL